MLRGSSLMTLSPEEISSSAGSTRQSPMRTTNTPPGAIEGGPGSAAGRLSFMASSLSD
jgi:hypothetical protein